MAVLNKYHLPGKTTPSDAVYIGRGSAWGNPFVIGQDGTRGQVIAMHRQKLWADIHSGRVSLQDIAALHGKDLVCFCAPQECHGHTLERAAAWAVQQLENQS